VFSTTPPIHNNLTRRTHDIIQRHLRNRFWRLVFAFFGRRGRRRDGVVAGKRAIVSAFRERSIASYRARGTGAEMTCVWLNRNMRRKLKERREEKERGQRKAEK
jgi:hypothetical protein